MEKRELDFPSSSDKSMHKNMLKKKKKWEGWEGLKDPCDEEILSLP